MSELTQSLGDSIAPMVVLDGVSKVFGTGPKAVTAVDSVSLTINRGEIFAIIGYSGAGKSTFAKMIAKALPIEAGEFHRDGKMRRSMSLSSVIAAWLPGW